MRYAEERLKVVNTARKMSAGSGYGTWGNVSTLQMERHDDIPAVWVYAAYPGTWSQLMAREQLSREMEASTELFYTCVL